LHSVIRLNLQGGFSMGKRKLVIAAVIVAGGIAW